MISYYPKLSYTNINTPASVYGVNKETAELTYIISRPCGDHGNIFFQEFSYNWDDGLFYRIWDEAFGYNVQYEKFSLDGSVSEEIPLDFNYGYNVFAMEYVGANTFLLTADVVEYGTGLLAFINTTGAGDAEIPIGIVVFVFLYQ